MAEDCLDLSRHSSPIPFSVSILHPLGEKMVTAEEKGELLPWVYTMDTDANLLFAFSDVLGGEILTLYLKLAPVMWIDGGAGSPEIAWSWGGWI